MRRQPGVSAVGFATNIPFSGHNCKSAAVVEGNVARPEESPRGIYSYGVAGITFERWAFRWKQGDF
ncbi:MAG: hypothetical protein JO340_10035 [Acidobacteriaceae bacterium]|nr:hypothetical protein [Acidobacteriaceae bacterium]